jgi:hypothetical protein
MKKLLAVILLVVVVSAVSFAQSAVANVTANVNAVLTITNTGALSLGSVNQGATATIASNAAGAATFTVAGAASAATTVTVAGPSGGNLTSGANTLPFTLVLPRYNTVNTQGTSTAFGLTTGGSTSTNATGQLYLWVGGSVTAAASQPSGSYTGTLTVSVTQP